MHVVDFWKFLKLSPEDIPVSKFSSRLMECKSSIITWKNSLRNMMTEKLRKLPLLLNPDTSGLRIRISFSLVRKTLRAVTSPFLRSKAISGILFWSPNLDGQIFEMFLKSTPNNARPKIKSHLISIHKNLKIYHCVAIWNSIGPFWTRLSSLYTSTKLSYMSFFVYSSQCHVKEFWATFWCTKQLINTI